MIRDHVGIERRSVWLGPIEVEWRRGLAQHVRFDPGGIKHADGGRGGVLTLRVTRDAGLDLTIWGRLFYVVGRTLNTTLRRWSEFRHAS